MLTLLPPTFGADSSANYPFLAWYDRSHEYAAALAAQEVREARYKGALWFPLVALAAAAIIAAHIYLGQSLLFLPAAVIPASLVIIGRKREVEMRGQSVECVVRRDIYGTPLDTALDEAAYQLTRYRQFRGQHGEDIRADLVKAIPAAEAWARRNAKLIRRAL